MSIFERIIGKMEELKGKNPDLKCCDEKDCTKCTKKKENEKLFQEKIKRDIDKDSGDSEIVAGIISTGTKGVDFLFARIDYSVPNVKQKKIIDSFLDSFEEVAIHNMSFMVGQRAYFVVAMEEEIASKCLAVINNIDLILKKAGKM